MLRPSGSPCRGSDSAQGIINATIAAGDMEDKDMATNSLQLVAPELRPALAAWPALDITADTLATVRGRGFGDVESPPGAPLAIERRIPGPVPGSTLRLLIIDPAPGTRNRPALLHLHGGGYVVGRRRSQLPAINAMPWSVAAWWCRWTIAWRRKLPSQGRWRTITRPCAGCTTMPTPLGVDANRIGVGGESAGGGHAAALAIAARERGQVPWPSSFSSIPCLMTAREPAARSPRSSGEFIWTAVSNDFGWSSLLGVPAGSQTVPEGAVPARIKDLGRLPPAFIGVGALDLFIEEDLEYARRLIAAGVPVEVHVAAGAYHGFDGLAPETAPARHFSATLVAALRRLIAASAAG